MSTKKDAYPLNLGVFPSSSARMTKLDSLSGGRGRVFDLEDSAVVMRNKLESRARDFGSYYRRDKPSNAIVEEAADILRDRYKSETDCDVTYPGVDALDSIAMTVPEDIVVMQVTEDGSKVIAAHVCQPFGWSADGVIGASFAEIHEGVKRPNGKLVIRDPEAVAKGIASSSIIMERIGAISFRSCVSLNTHPDYGGKDSTAKWHWGDTQQVYVRYERQVIIPMPKLGSFIFTIRPYYVDALSWDYIHPTMEAVRNATTNVYPREFLAKHKDNYLKLAQAALTMYTELLFDEEGGLEVDFT